MGLPWYEKYIFQNRTVKKYIGHYLGITFLIFILIPVILTLLRITSFVRFYQWMSLGTILIVVIVVIPIIIFSLLIGLINPNWMRMKSRNQVLRLSGIAFGIAISFLIIFSCLSGLLVLTGAGLGPSGLKHIQNIFFGGSVLLFLISLFAGFLLNKRLSEKKLISAIWGLGIVSSLFVIFGGLSIPNVDPRVFDVASRVCDGEVFEGAAEYSDSSPHPMIIGNNYEWTNLLPRNWWPESIDEVELVACLGDEYDEFISRCGYEMGYVFSRFQYYREIRLVRPRSGQTIASDVLAGGEPPACPSSMTDGDKEKHGSHVGSAKVINWIKENIPSQ